MRFSAWAVAAAMFVGASHADAALIYDIRFNTAPANGVNAFIDFQFVRADTDGDGNRDPASPLTLTLTRFATDGALGAEEQLDGVAAGSLPGTLTFGNAADFNAYLREITYGNLTTFRITVDGPGLSPGAFGTTVFGIASYDRARFNMGEFAPILSNEDGIAALFTFSGGGATIETPNTIETGMPSIAVTLVPEPASWALMIGGFGIAGGALRGRTRRVAYT